jgi:Transposase DDE domain/Transposase domain (DUF772)
MRPPLWHPPVELSAAEQAVVARIRRAKLFTFLRRIRHLLVSDPFQEELAGISKDSREGWPPVPPAQLALATILQAYTGVSDDEVIEALAMDRRWQLVLDCLDAGQAPFGKGTLVRFRAALIAQGLDRRLLERTVELAEQAGGFGPRPLRAALDSSPLWGAGRVEDTLNLLGHALRKALGVIARQQGRELAMVAADAGAAIVAPSSLQAALDRDWDDPAALPAALAVVLAALDRVEHWLAPDAAAAAALPAPARAGLAAAHQIRAQDVTVAVAGSVRLRRGVAADRRIAIEDPAMRHGRKNRTTRIDGYKRHVLRDLDSGVVRAAGITAAHVPEAAVTDAIAVDVAAQQGVLGELHIDRAYLSSRLVRERPPELAVDCKAWPVRTGPTFAKSAFWLDWDQRTIRCPGGVTIPFSPGSTVPFPRATCAACPLRSRCTTNAQGRTVTIHPDERLLAELRERQQTADGRAKLRERVAVEHRLAHVGHWQGDRARYIGERKNLFDLRRVAVVHNLHVWIRYTADTAAEAA